MQKNKPVLLIMGTEDEVKRTFGVNQEELLHDMIFGNDAGLKQCKVCIAGNPTMVAEVIERYTVLLTVAFVEVNTWKSMFLYEFQREYPQIAIMGMFDTITESEMQYAKALFMESVSEQKAFSFYTFSFSVCREMKKRLAHEDAMNIFQHKLVLGEPTFLQHTFWRNVILDERWFDDQEMFAKGRELGIQLDVADTYVLVLCRRIRSQQMMEQTILESFEESKPLFEYKEPYEIVAVEASAVCLIIPVTEKNYRQLCNSVSVFVRDAAAQGTGWCTYTSTVTLLPILRQKYLELREMERRNVSPKSRNFLLEEMPLYNRVNVIEGSEWIQHFAEGKITLIREELSAFVSMLVENGELNIESMYGIVHRLSMAFYASMEMRKQPVNEMLTTSEYLEKFNQASRSVENLYVFLDYLENYNQSVIKNLQEDHFLSIQIRQYIKDHIEEDLTREEIANSFFMSKDYISHIFKKETGESLISAINEEKIRKAKEMLITSAASVSEIATNLGITNFSYFTRIFKKETGVSPQEFRKNAWNRT
ncbi:MAG: AraC family transcriptional regulator [Lachnospiraceae bacterium]|nr:AraC family transcriptional regulator [Lachnospiraceae bacterium]